MMRMRRYKAIKSNFIVKREQGKDLNPSLGPAEWVGPFFFPVLFYTDVLVQPFDKIKSAHFIF